MWAHARAALILLAIVIGLLDGAPIPSPKHAPASMRDTVKSLARARAVLMTPFRPLGDLFRLRQQWKLFPTARREQHLMWVEAQREGGSDWELLYRPNDPVHRVMEDRIEYRRLRGAWNPGSRGTQTGYGPFVEWLSGEIFRARADVAAVRVRMEKILLDGRRGGYVADGGFEHQKIERRRRWERRQR